MQYTRHLMDVLAVFWLSVCRLPINKNILVRYHLENKTLLLSCCWNRHDVLFLFGWGVVLVVRQFVVSDAFFPPSFLSHPQKNHADYSKKQSYPLIYWYFNFNPIFFVLSPFVKFRFVFNFIIQFQSVICYFFFLI